MWPADVSAIAAAQRFLERSGRSLTAIACDSDVDGLASAVILERALAALDGESRVLPARRGEHVHRSSMKSRIRATGASRLLVADMGSRPEPILPDTPTLIIDHHHAAAGVPPGAIVVNGYDRPPVAPSSVLAFVVCRGIATIAGSGWLAELGAVADLGSAAPFRTLLPEPSRGVRWTAAASLLNAARRAPQPDPDAALNLLRKAEDINDVTSGRLPETGVLERYREEVRRERDRCSRVPPVLTDTVALIRFSSGAQVHPVVATMWARRLRPRIVMAANDGYLPGRTNFAVRCDADVDLVAWLRSLPFSPAGDAEFANGHARATGGSLSKEDFTVLLEVLGFPRRASRARRTGSG